MQQEPQQVTKEPQQVTTKSPKKVEVGRRLAVHNRRTREELKAQKQKTSEQGFTSEVSQYYGTFSAGAIIAVGVIGGLDYYLFQAKKGEVPPQQPSHPQRDNPLKANKFQMD